MTDPVSRDSNSLVSFIIGKEGETVKFTAHKEVVCYHSTVLEAAFNSNFIEGQTQTYRVEDTTEGVFKLFMQWIYSQKLTLKQLDDSWTPVAAEEVSEYMNLMKLWVLADRLCIPCLQNAVITASDEISEEHPTLHSESCKYIYANTTIDSALRRYTVACFSLVDSDTIRPDNGRYPHQMLLDVVKHLLRRQEGLEKKRFVISDYFVKEN